MTKDYKDGGLQAIDFDGTLKINWLKSFLNHNNFWFHIPRELFKKLEGIEFLLNCDFTVQRLPIKSSKFLQQVLLYWKIFYNHNFTPHNTPLWNNRYIMVRNKSLFDKIWLEKVIWAVSHLIDSNTGIISYEHFCIKYNFICNRASFESITKAIAKAVVCQIKEILSYSVSIIPHLPVLLVEGCDFKGSQLSNKTVRNKCNHISYPLLVYRNSISHYFSKDSIHRLRTEYLKSPLPPKVKEVHFKILNGIYPSSEYLRLRFGFD